MPLSILMTMCTRRLPPMTFNVVYGCLKRNAFTVFAMICIFSTARLFTTHTHITLFFGVHDACILGSRLFSACKQTGFVSGFFFFSSGVCVWVGSSDGTEFVWTLVFSLTFFCLSRALYSTMQKCTSLAFIRRMVFHGGGG